MIRCKKRSIMLREIESIQGEQLCRTHEAKGLAWPGIRFPGNGMQLFLGEAPQSRRAP